MGGRVGMMVMMVAIAVAAPYAAGALAQGLSSAVVGAGTAGGAATTATTLAATQGFVGSLVTLSQASLWTMAAGGLAAGYAITQPELPGYDSANSGFDQSFYEPSQQPSYEYTGFESDYQFEGLDQSFNPSPQQAQGFGTLETVGAPDAQIPLFGNIPKIDPFGTEDLEAGQVVDAGDTNSGFGEFGQIGEQEEEFSGSLA
jgi:hypothetical protein